MATIRFALALALSLSIPETPQETWDELAEDYERAFVAWIEEMSPGARDKPEEERPTPPATTYWPRFEALSARGEPRATVWMLQNLRGESEERAAHASPLFERVRAAGGAAWVARALPALADERASLASDALDEYLAELLRTATDRDVRVAALLASAALEPDRERAHALRLRAASLRWKSFEPGPEERIEGERLAEIATAMMKALPVEEHNWHENNFFEEKESYYPRAEFSPRPKDTWGPVIDTLAARGDMRARVWLLRNTWPETEEEVCLLREYLDALSHADIEEKEMRDLSWSIGIWVEKLGADFVEPRVRALADRAGERAKPDLLYGLGDGMCEAAQDDSAREKGLALLREVQERWPDSDASKRAAGKLFRYTNIVVGKPVPELEAEDADGNALALSDSLGKVTVLVFWGFW